MTDTAYCPPPADWDWSKYGTRLYTCHGDDCIAIYAQRSKDTAPHLIGAYTPQHALGLALGLLRAIKGLSDHQLLIAAVDDAEPPGIA